jgi:hypothetical protein
MRFVERLASTLSHQGTVGDPHHPNAREVVKEVADRLEARIADGDLPGVFRAIDEALDESGTLSWKPMNGGGPRHGRGAGADPDPYYWG